MCWLSCSFSRFLSIIPVIMSITEFVYHSNLHFRTITGHDIRSRQWICILRESPQGTRLQLLFIQLNFCSSDSVTSIANTLEILQVCSKPLIWMYPAVNNNRLYQKMCTWFSCAFVFLWLYCKLSWIYTRAKVGAIELGYSGSIGFNGLINWSPT